MSPQIVPTSSTRTTSDVRYLRLTVIARLKGTAPTSRRAGGGLLFLLIHLPPHGGARDPHGGARGDLERVGVVVHAADRAEDAADRLHLVPDVERAEQILMLTHP